MPQPALHLLLAHASLDRWMCTDAAPFAVRDTVAVNAFLHGCLGPDLGYFPGGMAELAAVTHTGRTGEQARALLAHAGTEAARAFSYGWLSHIIADVLIHPLVDEAAAAHAGGRTADLVDHVQVEVGLDAWLAWQQPVLRAIRLRPAFTRSEVSFIGSAMRDVEGLDVGTAQLIQMQHGMRLFTHAALHFTTTLVRDVCWNACDDTRRAPLTSAAAWRLLAAVFSRRSVARAWLRPAQPQPWLLTRVQQTIPAYVAAVEEHAASRLEHLPDYDLETGMATRSDQRVA